MLGDIPLKNRIVMAPMTRCRAIANTPGALEATYYGQRATAGLIITEGTAPAPEGLGYPRIPGIFTDDQIAGWKGVTDAVHEKGGKMFIQVMHTGRVGHPLNLPAGRRVIGPSALAAPGKMYTDAEGEQPYPVPEEMNETDIEAAIEGFVIAAKNAVAAGFDGVELHGANGYLIDQFINTASNQRADSWGGSVEGRCRFPIAVAQRVAAAIGPKRVGIRLSPAGGFNGMNTDDDAVEVYTALASAFSDMGLVYIHLVDHSALGTPAPSSDVVAGIRNAFNGALILSGGYDGERAETDLAAGNCELIAFGRPFISNPELPKKIKARAELLPPKMEAFYTPGPEGYIDYPL
jgi:N-ethylmaleimide reductase